MTTFTISPAIAADAAFLPAIEQSAGELFARLPELAWLTMGENKSIAIYQALVDAGWVWIAGDAGGERCGFIAAERIGDTLHICELGVALPAQRRSIGTALMRTAIEAAANHGLRAVTLTTFTDVAWNAPAYERAGFRRLGPDGIGIDLRIILEREAATGLPADRRCAMQMDLT